MLEKPTVGSIGGTEQGVFNARPNCDAFCIAKDKDLIWDRWHKTGMNYTEGDSLKYTDRNDVNVTAELAWNITKYFMINPDCWLSDLTYEVFDSPSDGDTLNDSIRANFTINTILPNDKTMLKVIYAIHGNPETENLYSINNYTISSAGYSDSIVFSIPHNATEGNYSLRLELYNSTGRINDIVGIYGTNYNETSSSSTYHLYHALGYANIGDSTQDVDDRITGVSFTANEDASANNITVYLSAQDGFPPVLGKCMIYRSNDSALIGTTGEISVTTGGMPQWKVFTFYSDPQPQLVQGVEYTIVCWTNGACSVYYDDSTFSKGRYYNYTYGTPPTSPSFTNEDRLYSIYCAYTPN